VRPLFDHLVSPVENRKRHDVARQIGGCGVDDHLEYSNDLRLWEREQMMTVSGISHYRGGTIDEVAPLAKKLKAIYLKHGVAYRLSRFQTGPNAGDWFVAVQHADQTAHEKAQAAIAQDPECQQTFAEIAKFAKRISREMVIDLDL
jgi:hypothetical protein